MINFDKFTPSFIKDRRSKASKKAIEEAMSLIHSLKKMQEVGALKINLEKREIHLVLEIFWNGKSTSHHQYLLRNLHFIMELNLEKPTDLPISIYKIDLDTKKHSRFATYLPIGNKIILD